MDVIGRLMAGILAVVLIVIFPLQYLAQQNIEILDSHVEDHTKLLSDSIREKGYLDQEMYEDFVYALDRTGELYDIDMEDIHPVTGEEIETAHVHTDAYCLASSTNERGDARKLRSTSGQSGSTKLLSSETHVHTDACYAGHRHGESGCSVTGTYYTGAMPPFNVTAYNPMDYRYQVNITCGTCGNVIGTMMVQMYPEYEGTQNVIQLTEYYWDGTYGYMYGQFYPNLCTTTKIIKRYLTSGLNPEWESYKAAWYNFYYNRDYSVDVFANSLKALGFTVDYSCANCLALGNITATANNIYSCGLVEDTTPICEQVVTAIAANHPNQTMFRGGSIDTGATARYLDGHTGAVSCSVTGFDPNTIGTQTVTLTYSGLVGTAKTYGTRTCTITVTVKENAKQCSAGLGHPDYSSSLSACPVCTAIAGISANNQSFAYDGNHHELTIGNTTGVTMNAAYDTDPGDGISWSWGTGPTQIGTYPVHIYVWVKNTLTGVEEAFFVMERYITILPNLTGITVSPSELEVERYTKASDLPITLTASYLNGVNKTITTGYSVSGYNPSTLGQQNVTIAYTEGGITKSANVKVTVTVLHRTCPGCGNTYDLTPEDTDPGCPYCKSIITGLTVSPEDVTVEQGDNLPITVTAIYADGSTGSVTGWSSNYDSSIIGVQLVTIQYAGYSAEITVCVEEAVMTCPVCGTEYPVSLGYCPVCAETVLSISASPLDVTVCQYEDIPLTVTAFYQEGSSKVVTDWSIDCTTNTSGTYEATVSYQNASVKINLTVVPESAITCPICGTVYEPSEHPKGCPSCSNQLVGIEAYLTSGSNLVQYGSTPGVYVVLIFRDEHRELTEEGYTIDDFNSKMYGAQTITVSYQSFTTTLDIEVVNALGSVTCPNGHVYYLNGDGTDPGCPYCQMVEELGAVKYFDITNTTDILEAVYRDGKYLFEPGNYLTIRVTKKDKSLLSKMQYLYPRTSLLGQRKKFVTGGEVS